MTTSGIQAMEDEKSNGASTVLTKEERSSSASIKITSLVIGIGSRTHDDNENSNSSMWCMANVDYARQIANLPQVY